MTSADLKALVANYRKTAETFTRDAVWVEMQTLFASNAKIQMCHPFDGAKCVF
jgi:hypothetical protein